MTQELENYRKEIDVFDDQIIDLLKNRLAIVKKVGAHKKQTASNLCPIRPGREATMLRRIAKVFSDSDFAPAAAAQMWRLIIGTSTALEADLTISVYAPDNDRDLFWLTREYFGPSAMITKQPHVKRVIGDVMDGKAAVGVIPILAYDVESNWWTHLLQASPKAPKIFAHLPYVYSNENPKHFPAGLAFSRVVPEDSGDDMSLYVLEADHDVSQSRLQTAFSAVNLSANWITIASIAPNLRHHVIELKGFVMPDNAGFKSFLSALGASIQQAHFLGSYAVPFTIPQQEQQKETA